MITDHRSPSSACRLVFDVQGVEHRLRSLWRDGLLTPSGIRGKLPDLSVSRPRRTDVDFPGPPLAPRSRLQSVGGLCCGTWSSVEIRVSIVGVGAGV